MSVGTPFHAADGGRSTASCSGASGRATSPRRRTPTHHDIEYNAIRKAAALIDVSPLYKYRVAGPDATRLVDRVITRDATRLAAGRVYLHAVVRRARQGHRRRHGPRLDDGAYRWTAADPQCRWLRLNARRPRRRPSTTNRRAVAARRPPGTAVAGRAGGRDRASRSRTSATSGDARRRIGGRRGRCQPHRLHRRPRLRDLDPGRRRATRSGTALMEVGRRLRDPAGRACSPWTSRAWRPGSSCSRSTTRRRATP